MMWFAKLSVLALLNALVASAQGTSPTNAPLLRKAQLLSASAGWVLVGDHLLWSNNLGRTWNDITPKSAKRIDEVFFLNRLAIWTVMVAGEGHASSLSVARTIDGGATWVAKPFVGPSERLFAEDHVHSALTFSDPRHGWLLMQRASGSSFRFGELFSTEDGGESWEKLPQPPIAGELRFISSKVGWIQGGPFGLYATRDSGRTWQQQKLLPPPGVPTGAEPYYSLPKFAEGSATQAVLVVTFESAGSSVVAAYKSLDTGQSWKLAQSEKDTSGNPIASDVVGQQVIRMFNANEQIKVGPIGTRQVLSHPPASSQDKSILQITFADPEHGWALLAGGSCRKDKQECYAETALWATIDGGRTFSDRTPALVSPERIDQVSR